MGSDGGWGAPETTTIAKGDHVMAMERTTGLRAGVAALIVGLVVSQGALAEPSIDAETAHRAIDVRALNLSSPAGAQEAYKRIAAAAQSICAPLSGLKGVARARDERDRAQPCFDAAVRGALEQVANATGIDLKRVAELDPANRDRLVAGR
jgi:UrcA family protein